MGRREVRKPKQQKAALAPAAPPAAKVVRKWLWAGNVKVREHLTLGPGTARLDEVIERFLAGDAKAGDVAPVQGDIDEVRAQVGTNPYRAYFFEWGPHYVCVMSRHKNQQQMPKAWIDLCIARRKAFIKEYGKHP